MGFKTSGCHLKRTLHHHTCTRERFQRLNCPRSWKLSIIVVIGWHPEPAANICQQRQEAARWQRHNVMPLASAPFSTPSKCVCGRRLGCAIAARMRLEKKKKKKVGFAKMQSIDAAGHNKITYRLIFFNEGKVSSDWSEDKIL